MKFARIIAIASIVAIALPVASQKNKAKGKPAGPSQQELLDKARSAVKKYDFATAAEAMEEYVEGLKDDPVDEELMLMHIAEMGDRMLERVEDIVIVDSITVDKNSFFKAYRLSPQTGSFHEPKSGNSPIYITQDGLTELFSYPDGDGRPSIAISRALADGSAESPRVYPNAEGIEEAAYPFLMPDGLTLYFAGKGEQSLGGFDIFITRRSSVNDDFLQPQNVGMPFNSPYDDYLLVIDEATGIGWWATDRNQLGDKLTIYTYLPKDLRTNLSPDTEDLRDRAFIRSVAATQPRGFVKPDVESLVHKSKPANMAPEFEFALPGGRVVTSVSELKSRRSRELMEDYLESIKNLDFDRQRLASLREKYGKGDKSVANEILRLEKNIEADAAALLDLSNEIVRSEK